LEILSYGAGKKLLNFDYGPCMYIPFPLKNQKSRSPTGPEKYREHGNSVPRTAEIWQVARSPYHEEPGRLNSFLAPEAGQIMALCLA
jgi:hypothetical protein